MNYPVKCNHPHSKKLLLSCSLEILSEKNKMVQPDHLAFSLDVVIVLFPALAWQLRPADIDQSAVEFGCGKREVGGKRWIVGVTCVFDEDLVPARF